MTDELYPGTNLSVKRLVSRSLFNLAEEHSQVLREIPMCQAHTHQAVLKIFNDCDSMHVH